MEGALDTRVSRVRKQAAGTTGPTSPQPPGQGPRAHFPAAEPWPLGSQPCWLWGGPLLPDFSDLQHACLPGLHPWGLAGSRPLRLIPDGAQTHPASAGRWLGCPHQCLPFLRADGGTRGQTRLGGGMTWGYSEGSRHASAWEATLTVFPLILPRTWVDVCPPPSPHLGREHTATLTLSSPNHNSRLTYAPPGGWILGPRFPPSALSPRAQKLGVRSPDSQGHVAWVAGISGVINGVEMGFLELGQSLHPYCWFPAWGRAQGTRAWMEGG